jgi:hypothetical protein
MSEKEKLNESLIKSGIASDGKIKLKKRLLSERQCEDQCKGYPYWVKNGRIRCRLNLNNEIEP